MAQFMTTTGGNPRTRKNRSPNFPVMGLMKPFGLYPIFGMPILPGETVTSLSLQWRALSMPIQHPLIGAWLEVFVYYCKLTDIDRALTDMFLTDTMSTSGYTSGGGAGGRRHFAKSGDLNWVKLCQDKFHAAYFLDEGETPRTVDNVPKTKVLSKRSSWMDNLILKPAEGALTGTDFTQREEMTAADMYRYMQLTEMTYEQYLRQYGAVSVRQGEGKPEIWRYAQSWVQPVNTVEPTTGAPSSAWVWSDKVMLENNKRATEPGFVMVCARVAPKTFRRSPAYSMIGQLWGFMDWFPSYNLEDPLGGIKELTGGDNSPFLGAISDPPTADNNTYLYDHRDLLSHGEQFVNRAYDDAEWPYRPNWGADADLQTGATPQDVRGEYVSDADIDAMFKSNAAGKDWIYYEGLGRANVAGHVTDQT